MPKAKRLTEFERGQIQALSASGISSRSIAKKIGSSKTVVNNFSQLQDNYGKTNAGGRAKALSSREERRVLRLASTEKYSSTEIIQPTGLENVIDGDLCEQFNSLEPAKQKSIATDLERNPSEVSKKLEDIRTRYAF